MSGGNSEGWPLPVSSQVEEDEGLTSATAEKDKKKPRIEIIETLEEVRCGRESPLV